MTLMSPRRMFQSCGSSSIEVRRRIAPDARDPAVSMVDRVAGAHALRADDHRPQLQDVEVDAVLPDTGLAVEDRPAILELDRERRETEEAGS